MATTDSNTEALEWLQKLQPNRDPYEYLVQRKFPGYKAVQYAPISLGNIGRSGISHDDRREKLLKEVESFRAELKAKPLREIKTLYEQEQEKERQALAAKAEREEQQRFFNRPDANADFIHWAKMTYWTLDEALALTFGKSPEIVKWDAVKYVDTRISPFAREYARLRELVLRAKNWKQLYDPALPSLFLAWARRNEIEVAPELVKEVEARGVVIADWKDHYDKLNEQAKKLSEHRDELIAICTKLTAERDGFKQKAAELESQVWEGFDEDRDIYPPELDIAMLHGGPPLTSGTQTRPRRVKSGRG